MAEVTIYTLAKKLNMTPSMISRALSPNGKISEDKRQIVLAAAKECGYAPNKFAPRLSMKPIRIGVLLCSKFKVNTDKMMEGIRLSHDGLKDYKIEYDVSVFDSSASDHDIRDALDKYSKFDGVILSGMSASKYTPLILELYEKNNNIAQVQSINEEAPCLFGSKHNENTASGIAADFLYNCVRYSERKNVFLFTGDLTSTVHANSAAAFEKYCSDMGLSLLSSVDMKDNEEYFESILPAVFSKYENQIDGIYITSGISAPLCRYLEAHRINIPLVTFDTYDTVKEYMEKGIVSASISQDVTHQMRVAFDMLVEHIMTDSKCERTVFTDVNLMLKSNMHQFN